MYIGILVILLKLISWDLRCIKKTSNNENIAEWENC